MVTRDTSNPWPAEHLWIAGDGALARSVLRLAGMVDFEVSLFDRESDLANCGSDFTRSKLPATPTLGLVLADGLEQQVQVLGEWVTGNFAFLGLLANRARRAAIFSRLAEVQFSSADKLDRLVKPLAPGLGTVSTEEMSISIVSQLIQNRCDRRISHEAASRIRSPSLIKARA